MFLFIARLNWKKRVYDVIFHEQLCCYIPILGFRKILSFHYFFSFLFSNLVDSNDISHFSFSNPSLVFSSFSFSHSFTLSFSFSHSFTLIYTHLHSFTLIYTQMSVNLHSFTLIYTHLHSFTLIYTHLHSFTLIYTF